ncbi:MAG: hypothetical protein Q9M50_02430 [Methylococcales bacterium]|nr:hypothetical protein [Methylococcales bacterium]
MSYELDPKEAYLYGVLLELTKKQVTAMHKQLAGNLGIWGKSRLNSRTKEIQKIIFHLFNKKNASSKEILSKVLADFKFIESDTALWADTTSEEINYLRTVLKQLV